MKRIPIYEANRLIAWFPPHGPGVTRVADWADPSTFGQEGEVLYRLPDGRYVLSRWSHDSYDWREAAELLDSRAALEWHLRRGLDVPAELRPLLAKMDVTAPPDTEVHDEEDVARKPKTPDEASQGGDPLVVRRGGNNAEVVLTPDAAKLLEALLKEHPQTVFQYELAEAVCLGRRTVGGLLARLRERGLTHRPEGERKGETLTAYGLEVARHISGAR
jgi:predicted transcriptional regulator